MALPDETPQRVSDSRTIRILAFPRQSLIGASTRYRFAQFVPHLEASGFTVDIAPLFDPDYLRSRYRSGSRSPLKAAFACVGRLGRMWGGPSYDLLWVEKEVFPWLPAVLE